jgi:hypothetical protein
MSWTIRFSRAYAGRARDLTITFADETLIKGLVELTVWVFAIHGWRPRTWRIGPQRRRFEFESLMLTADGNPRIVTSFFFIEKNPRTADRPHIRGAWWTTPHTRLHWASWDGEDRDTALRAACASLRFVLRHDSPWALEDDRRLASGAAEHEFAPAELDAATRLLPGLTRVFDHAASGVVELHWEGPGGQLLAWGRRDRHDSWPGANYVSVQLHPRCQGVSVSGPEADPLFALGSRPQPRLASRSFEVVALLGATAQLLQQRG